MNRLYLSKTVLKFVVSLFRLDSLLKELNIVDPCYETGTNADYNYKVALIIKMDGGW